MYNWRKMTPDMREDVLRLRKQQGQPWHGPPHGLEKDWWHISAACYEHRPFLGSCPERMAFFERDLLTTLGPVSEGVTAWAILPTHYHVLLQCINVPACRKALGKLHGKSAFAWNAEEEVRGRTCWHRCLTKPVKSESHRWATLNYIHHNPVHHGYVETWQEWPFSSAILFLEHVGRDTAEQMWKEYPVLEYGKGWDEPQT